MGTSMAYAVGVGGGGCRMFVEETWGVGVGVAVAVGVGVLGGGRDCMMFVEETWSKARMQNWNDWVIPTERFLYGRYWDPTPERRVPWG